MWLLTNLFYLDLMYTLSRFAKRVHLLSQICRGKPTRWLEQNIVHVLRCRCANATLNMLIQQEYFILFGSLQIPSRFRLNVVYFQTCLDSNVEIVCTKFYLQPHTHDKWVQGRLVLEPFFQSKSLKFKVYTDFIHVHR